MVNPNQFRLEVEEALKNPLLESSEEGIKLNQNESPWDIPVDLKVAITEKLIKTDFNRYPLDDISQFKKILAKQNEVFADQIALANGSPVLLQALIHVIRPKSKVLILDPSNHLYGEQVKLFGHHVVRVPLSSDFVLSAEAVLSVVKKENPSLILIANPNVPTGNLFPKETLYKIIRTTKCLTVIDETFFPFSGETLCDWLAEFPHLLILRSFSKAYALAGVRLGYLLGDADVIFQIEKVLPFYCVSKIAIVIASEVLHHDDFVDAYVSDILKERRRLFENLQLIHYVSPFPSDTNFILFRVPNSKFVFRELKKRGIFIRDVSDESRLKNCLRVTVGSPEENTEFLQAMKEIMG